MTQHFLLSAAARTLRLEAVMRMSEDEARRAFARIRWHERNGEPACPRCGGVEPYFYTAEQLWKCKGCGYRFSLTSGTIFASRKLPFRDILVAIAFFANGDKKHSAMQLSRDLDVQYRTAFLLAHKIRDSLNAKNKGLQEQGGLLLNPAEGVRVKSPVSVRKIKQALCEQFAADEDDEVVQAALVMLAPVYIATFSLKAIRAYTQIPFSTVKKIAARLYDQGIWVSAALSGE
jgi:transposase-like protein